MKEGSLKCRACYVLKNKLAAFHGQMLIFLTQMCSDFSFNNNYQACWKRCRCF